ncbi:MAG: DHA2 family efflux MFS transporter permease subunit [Pseudomonadota bacterium]
MTASHPQDVTWRTWAGFGAMCAGMFMAILDIQIVATSLPAIRDALGISADKMSWIQTAYLIAEVIAIPLTGFLSRAFSVKGLFLGALAIFTAASVGCAYSPDFETLIAFRIVQGLSGGCLIPLVFSAVFLMFPEEKQALATTLGGVLAVTAPTLGPIVGGYITQTYSWPWLFLINVAPGILAFFAATKLLPAGDREKGLIRKLDWLGLIALAVGLACLEIGLKEAPERGWGSPVVLGLMAIVVVAGAFFITRSLRIVLPITDLRLFSDRNFAIACTLSFLLGMSLFGANYLMPVFLGLVRGHGPLDIGIVMLVTGIAQLVTAPIAVQFEQRFDARWLTASGFLFLAIGVGWSYHQTVATDFDEMFWPQVFRGGAMMFCLLPPTAIALGMLQKAKVPDGSALFNLMRNLGGAIGIALIDTVIWQRAPHHGKEIGIKLLKQDPDAIAFADISVYDIPPPGFVPPEGMIEMIKPTIEKVGLTAAINEAWAMLAGFTLLALILIFFVRPDHRSKQDQEPRTE